MDEFEDDQGKEIGNNLAIPFGLIFSVTQLSRL